MADLFASSTTTKRVTITPQEEGESKPWAIDATIEENHVLASTITEFPLEDGSTISDHIIEKPFKLTLNCVISDDPISFTDTLESTALGLSSSVFGEKAAIVAGVVSKIGGDLLAQNTEKISKNAKETLEGYKKNGTLLTIATSLEVYSNMLIESIPINRTAQTAASLNFSMVLKQVTIVSKELVTVDLSSLAKDAEGAAAELEGGRISIDNSTGAVAEKGASWLVKMATYIGE